MKDHKKKMIVIMMFYLIPLLIIASIITLPACTYSTGNIGIGEYVFTPDGTYIFKDNVIINNQALARRLEIIDVKARIENNIMKAMVQVKNQYDTDYSFEYRYEWYDSKDFEIASVKEHWAPVLISGKETRNLMGVAPSPEATKFKIIIRASHPVK